MLYVKREGRILASRGNHLCAYLIPYNKGSCIWISMGQPRRLLSRGIYRALEPRPCNPFFLDTSMRNIAIMSLTGPSSFLLLLHLRKLSSGRGWTVQDGSSNALWKKRNRSIRRCRTRENVALIKIPRKGKKRRNCLRNRGIEIRGKFDRIYDRKKNRLIRLMLIKIL